MQINPRSITITRFDEPDLEFLDGFNCGDDEMNRFLREECYVEQQAGLNSTQVLYYNGQLAAFVSLCADRVALTENEADSLPRKSVPALKVARLGRDIRFRDFKFGERLLKESYKIAYELSLSQVGIRYVTLDAYASREEYYLRHGFVRNQQQPRGNTVSMRYDIYSE